MHVIATTSPSSLSNGLSNGRSSSAQTSPLLSLSPPSDSGTATQPKSMDKVSSTLSWYYVGQDGETYGPNTPAQMLSWYREGYFSMSVLMRTEKNIGFHTLAEWVTRCDNQLPFFVSFPKSVAESPTLSSDDDVLKQNGQTLKSVDNIVEGNGGAVVPNNAAPALPTPTVTPVHPSPMVVDKNSVCTAIATQQSPAQRPVYMMPYSNAGQVKETPETKWYYVGEDGETTYGPNSSLAMWDWLRCGYFSPNILIKTENDDRFYPLAEWFACCGNQVPFFLNILSMPALKSTLNYQPMVSNSMLSVTPQQQSPLQSTAHPPPRPQPAVFNMIAPPPTQTVVATTGQQPPPTLPLRQQIVMPLPQPLLRGGTNGSGNNTNGGGGVPPFVMLNPVAGFPQPPPQIMTAAQPTAAAGHAPPTAGGFGGTRHYYKYH